MFKITSDFAIVFSVSKSMATHGFYINVLSLANKIESK